MESAVQVEREEPPHSCALDLVGRFAHAHLYLLRLRAEDPLRRDTDALPTVVEPEVGLTSVDFGAAKGEPGGNVELELDVARPRIRMALDVCTNK